MIFFDNKRLLSKFYNIESPNLMLINAPKVEENFAYVMIFHVIQIIIEGFGKTLKI